MTNDSKELQYYKNILSSLNKVINELNLELSNINNLSLEDINSLENQLKNAKLSIIKIKTHNKNILKKIYINKAKKDPKVKNKLKDQTSLEFNEILLSQGKAAKSIQSLENLAKKGDIEAQYIIGKTFLNGVIGYYNEIKMKDVGLGLKWLTLAFNKGHLEAGYLIGLYEKSVLNTENAIKIFEKLSQKNHYKSLKELEIIYEKDPVYNSFEKSLEIKAKLGNIQ